MTGGESLYQDMDLGDFGSRWYFSRREIEENSPSRKDGIDLKKETYLRKSYCTFLQDLGIRLKVPQVTIATAIVLCHRFFLRQSHVKNDRRTIATVCMFLAGKAEETPRPLKDVILVSYEIMHKKDPSAVQRIKQKEVCDRQKELIQLAERVVLSTLGFDLNVHHPYKPLVEAIKKFKVAQNALAQVAWNFVNDGLRTSLCLQFKPHHIAAGAIFLAAKFLKVKLPSDGEKFWWQEFDVTPRQLEDVSNQMLELYEQNRPLQATHANEVEGSTSGGTNQTVVTSSTINENPPSTNVRPHSSEVFNAKQGVRVPQPARQSVPPTSSDLQKLPQSSSLTQSNENASTDTKSEVFDRKADNEEEDCLHNEVGQHGFRGSEAIETRERKVDAPASKAYDYPDSVSKLDRNKFKAALERRRKQGSDVSTETNSMDEDDLIEREIENGIEMAVEDEKLKQEKRTGWPKPLNYTGLKSQHGNPEGGELSFLDEVPLPTLKSSNGSDRAPIKRQHDLPHQSRDVSGRSWMENTERDHKRLRHDSHA